MERVQGKGGGEVRKVGLREAGIVQGLLGILFLQEFLVLLRVMGSDLQEFFVFTPSDGIRFMF